MNKLNKIIHILISIFFSVFLLSCNGANNRNPPVVVEAPSADPVPVIFYIGGQDASFSSTDTVYKSEDLGVTWQDLGSVLPAAIHGCRAVYFQNKIWVVGGDTGSAANLVWSSSDGETWTNHGAVLPGTIKDHILIEYNSKLYVIGGSDGVGRVDTIWSSSDGLVWVDTGDTLAQPSAASQAVVFNNKIWIAGGQVASGEDSSVYTYDGTTLLDSSDLSISDLPTGVSKAGLVVLSSKMFVLGGQAAVGGIGDKIQSTSDGNTWVDEEVVNSKTLLDNLWVRATTYNDIAYIAGGYNGTAMQTSVSSSADGVNWSTVGSLPSARGEGDLVIILQ